MHGKSHTHNSMFGVSWSPANAALLIALTLLFLIFLLLFVMLTAQPAQAQMYQVIHTFTGPEGINPYSGVILDAAGNLYGVASGTFVNNGNGCGAVFRLSKKNSAWIYIPLYVFPNDVHGDLPCAPMGGLTFGPDGNLYGTTMSGNPTGNGTVFKLTPPAHIPPSISPAWDETILHAFNGSDGAWPMGPLTFDREGNLYGTTKYEGVGNCGALYGCGTVFQMTQANGIWSETPIVLFSQSNGALSQSSLTFDQQGNLYGTASLGPYNQGLIFQLTPTTGGNWTENIIFAFDYTNGNPVGGVIFDNAGNLYGIDEMGLVYELTPPPFQWNMIELYSGSGASLASLIFDSHGTLYGTEQSGGRYGAGAVFKLTPTGKGWRYTDLHDFNGNDGAYPYASGVTIDGQGNLYGTTWSGGQYNFGVVWEIMP